MKTKKVTVATNGEFFADYDETSASWCVFHTDVRQGHAYRSYREGREAQDAAREMNETL